MPSDYSTGRCRVADTGGPTDGEVLNDEEQREYSAERNWE